jgi:hypothetical protein
VDRFRRTRTLGAFAGLALGLVAGPVSAHHAIQALFDFDKPLTLRGVVTKVEWINPHAYLFLNVRDRSGKTKNWALEMTGPGSLRRAGLGPSDPGAFKVGDTISVSGFMSKDGTTTGFVKELTLANGRTVTIWFGDPYAR